MDNSITLSEYADAVNAVGRKRVEKLNAEFHAGKRLFGASHHDLPDTMIRGHYERGSSPQEAYEQIIDAL